MFLDRDDFTTINIKIDLTSTNNDICILGKVWIFSMYHKLTSFWDYDKISGHLSPEISCVAQPCLSEGQKCRAGGRRIRGWQRPRQCWQLVYLWHYWINICQFGFAIKWVGILNQKRGALTVARLLEFVQGVTNQLCRIHKEIGFSHITHKCSRPEKPGRWLQR